MSVAAGEADRQEFSFTLYDFDGHGKVTKDVSLSFGLVFSATFVETLNLLTICIIGCSNVCSTFLYLQLLSNLMIVKEYSMPWN